MLRVYLDQNIWVQLGTALHGRKRGDQFADTLEVCREAVKQRRASFPLDLYRYWETAKNHNDGSRNRLVDVMVELSQFDTLITPFSVLNYEIDVALNRRFARPPSPTLPRLFGRGINHASDGGVQRLMAEDPSPLGRRQEERLLRAGPRTHARFGVDPGLATFGDQFVNHEQGVAQKIQEEGWSSSARLGYAVRASDLVDIAPAIRERIEHAGISRTEFESRVKDSEWFRLIEELPTRWVTNVLRDARHSQPQKKWEPNDFIDVVALPVPVVYCDVVVTEKQWAHHLNQAKVRKRYGTIVTADVRDLLDILITASD